MIKSLYSALSSYIRRNQFEKFDTNQTDVSWNEAIGECNCDCSAQKFNFILSWIPRSDRPVLIKTVINI